MNAKTVAEFITNAVRHVSLPSIHSERLLPGIGGAIDMLLLFDISDSMAETDYSPTRLGAAQDAGAELLSRRVATGVDGRVGVVAFGDVGFPICPLTTIAQATKIETAIRSLKTRGGTNITAGLLAAEHFFTQASGQAMRREIAFLSDGWNKSGDDPRIVADRLKRAGCEIQTTGIGGNQNTVDEELLRAIASLDQSGKPLYRFIGDRGGLVRHFSEIGGLTR